jgi:hypothetical protein
VPARRPLRSSKEALVGQAIIYSRLGGAASCDRDQEGCEHEMNASARAALAVAFGAFMNQPGSVPGSVPASVPGSVPDTCHFRKDYQLA